MKFPAELKTEIKEDSSGACPKGQAPKLQPSSKQRLPYSQRENSWYMNSRVQENRRRRHEVGVAVTDRGFPATFIKDGLGSASMERTPKAGASEARKGNQEELGFSQRRELQ